MSFPSQFAVNLIRDSFSWMVGLNAEALGIIGHSEAIDRILSVLRKAAPSLATVLITGESGTGKELAARAVHLLSPRAEQPFISINCAAIPETLLESELFGHKKGAFTGSERDRDGRFVMANQGTLFLDEIGAMPLGLQAKLLRVIQEREVFPLGAKQPEPLDVRIVAATNEDLAGLVAANGFREDLYFRLNVIPLQLPSLRERRGDIPLLVNHFSKKHSIGGTTPDFSPDAVARLCSFEWPGNIRQLENVVQYCLTLAAPAKRIEVADLPPELRQIDPRPVPANPPPSPLQMQPGQNLDQALAAYERLLIEQALAASNGNKSEAARRLGVKRTTLIEKIKRLERDDPQESEIAFH